MPETSSSYPSDHDDRAYQKSRPSLTRLRYIDVEAHDASRKAVHKAETSGLHSIVSIFARPTITHNHQCASHIHNHCPDPHNYPSSGSWRLRKQDCVTLLGILLLVFQQPGLQVLPVVAWCSLSRLSCLSFLLQTGLTC
jgi:hypothetical protein